MREMYRPASSEDHSRWVHRGAVSAQSGAGLIEVLIGVVIAGLVMIGATTGLFTAITTSGDNQTRQRLEASLTAFGDSVKQLPYASTCATSTPAAYNAAYLAWANRWVPPSGFTATIESVDGVRYWDRSSRTYSTTCPAVDTGSQLITLRVTSDGMRTTASVVKRNPEARP